MNDQTFDLASAAERIDGEHIVLHPVTGAATAARIKLAGPEHDVRRAADNARQRAIRAELANTGKYSPPDPVDSDADATAFAAACTLGWSGLVESGVPITFEVGAASKLYSDKRYRWLRDQVLSAMNQRELFFNASASN